MNQGDSFQVVRWLVVLAIPFQFAVNANGQGSNALHELSLADHVTFHSTFDENTVADTSLGDGRLFTAKNWRNLDDATPGLSDPNVVLAKGQGLHGDALQFKTKERLITFYKAEHNVAYRPNGCSGSLSFWLQLDPARDLEPGYCDPIQVTDSAYNDAAIWVDFTKDNPRDFRLGIIGDLQSWNPEKVAPDGNPEFERRLITVKQPPFARGKWTHILINFSELNSDRGRSEFYLDGVKMGSLDVKDPFTWDASNARILLGLNYIGLLDELVVFDRPLSAKEVNVLFRAKGRFSKHD